MLYDPPPLETAEEKAQRIWRNKHILSRINNQQPQPITPKPQTIVDNTSIIKQLHKFKKDLTKLLIKNPTDLITKYTIITKIRKHKLLEEKLRRLESGMERNIGDAQ